MEKTLQTIPTEKDFNLSKVKLLPKGGIQAEYQVTQTVDGENSLIDRNETCTRDVHPDLLGLFADLRNIVGRVFNITSFLTLLESDEMKLPETKKALARSFADELLEKCRRLNSHVRKSYSLDLYEERLRSTIEKILKNKNIR